MVRAQTIAISAPWLGSNRSHNAGRSSSYQKRSSSFPSLLLLLLLALLRRRLREASCNIHESSAGIAINCDIGRSVLRNISCSCKRLWTFAMQPPLLRRADRYCAFDFADHPCVSSRLSLQVTNAGARHPCQYLQRAVIRPSC